ncbi:hypothetical protein Y032_0256g356 [Ancylostoma ceylanicum]|nr:hypothetical protein Y032_0256g356 [Ancylostoma ceylanicum]
MNQVSASSSQTHLVPIYRPRRDGWLGWPWARDRTIDLVRTQRASYHYATRAPNGHIGVAKDGYRCHGGFGCGTRNDDGERILENADSHELVIINTEFRRRPSHLASFYSGNAQTQTDFVLVRHRNQKLVADAKVAPYETVTTQYRPLTCAKEGARRTMRTGPNQTWENATRATVKVACSELGTTKPGRWKIDRQAWLWTDGVKNKAREKNRLYHIFLDDKTVDNWRQYLVVKNAAKKGVAAAKAAHYYNINRQLDAKEAANASSTSLRGPASGRPKTSEVSMELAANTVSS